MTQGQELVAYYVDECLEQGKPHMTKMKGHMARRAKELLDEGECTLEEIKRALTEFVRRGKRSPLGLAEVVVELASNESAVVTDRADARRRANEWIELNGWPTGAKFVRGTHSGSYVYDALGTERLPLGYGDWPYGKPSFDDVVVALEAGNV